MIKTSDKQIKSVMSKPWAALSPSFKAGMRISNAKSKEENAIAQSKNYTLVNSFGGGIILLKNDNDLAEWQSELSCSEYKALTNVHFSLKEREYENELKRIRSTKMTEARIKVNCLEILATPFLERYTDYYRKQKDGTYIIRFSESWERLLEYALPYKYLDNAFELLEVLN